MSSESLQEVMPSSGELLTTLINVMERVCVCVCVCVCATVSLSMGPFVRVSTSMSTHVRYSLSSDTVWIMLASSVFLCAGVCVMLQGICSRTYLCVRNPPA